MVGWFGVYIKWMDSLIDEHSLLNYEERERERGGGGVIEQVRANTRMEEPDRLRHPTLKVAAWEHVSKWVILDDPEWNIMTYEH